MFSDEDFLDRTAARLRAKPANNYHFPSPAVISLPQNAANFPHRGSLKGGAQAAASKLAVGRSTGLRSSALPFFPRTLCVLPGACSPTAPFVASVCPLTRPLGWRGAWGGSDSEVWRPRRGKKRSLRWGALQMNRMLKHFAAAQAFSYKSRHIIRGPSYVLVKGNAHHLLSPPRAQADAHGSARQTRVPPLPPTPPPSPAASVELDDACAEWGASSRSERENLWHHKSPLGRERSAGRPQASGLLKPTRKRCNTEQLEWGEVCAAVSDWPRSTESRSPLCSEMHLFGAPVKEMFKRRDARHDEDLEAFRRVLALMAQKDKCLKEFLRAPIVLQSAKELRGDNPTSLVATPKCKSKNRDRFTHPGNKATTAATGSSSAAVADAAPAAGERRYGPASNDSWRDFEFSPPPRQKTLTLCHTPTRALTATQTPERGPSSSRGSVESPWST
eukprot:GHVT01020112.1.p1 GENE.GHVT01020112.1~~GHVT01020112.1.p1  ORF type:complete len:446 (+),score=95.97 GHVT01020112.1:355-1692(+)